MLNIDTETMMIELTRGDSASIVFSAVDDEGNAWNPSATTDKITFAVAKKWGGDIVMEITNEYDGTTPATDTSLENFWTINIGTDDWFDDNGNDKFKFGDYKYDVQIDTSTGANTIIGKTDDIDPTFRVWEENAKE